MQIKNSLLDDLAKTVTGAMGGVSNLKGEADGLIKSHVERHLQQCDVVSQQEYMVLKKMIEKVIAENIALKHRIKKLERHIEE